MIFLDVVAKVLLRANPAKGTFRARPDAENGAGRPRSVGNHPMTLVDK